jgi:hypothetical protein
MSDSAANREEIMKKLLISSVNSETSYAAKNLPDLVSVRRQSGVTLEQIAGSTKIAMRYLQAIEEGSLGKLPGGVYTTNYLRQYAEACRRPPAEVSAAG